MGLRVLGLVPSPIQASMSSNMVSESVKRITGFFKSLQPATASVIALCDRCVIAGASGTGSADKTAAIRAAVPWGKLEGTEL